MASYKDLVTAQASYLLYDPLIVYGAGIEAVGNFDENASAADNSSAGFYRRYPLASIITALDGVSGITLCAWVYLTNASAADDIFIIRDSNGDRVAAITQSSDDIIGIAKSTASDSEQLSSAAQVSLNQWVFVAVTIDFANGQIGVKIGAADIVLTTGLSFTQSTFDSSALTVVAAGNNPAGNAPLSGRLQHIALFAAELNNTVLNTFRTADDGYDIEHGTAPALTAAPAASVAPQGEYTVTLALSGASGSVTWTLLDGPTGAAIDGPTGFLDGWTPGAEDAGQSFDFSVTAQDDNFTAQFDWSVYVTDTAGAGGAAGRVYTGVVTGGIL